MLILKDKIFSRAYRLVDADVYKRLVSQRPLNSPLFRLRAMPGDQAVSRLGMVVPKRSIPRAVKRNRVKRLIRDYFRHNRDALGTTTDLVITALPGAARASHEEVRACLDQLWQRLIKRYGN